MTDAREEILREPERPHWKPQHCPGHEPTAANMVRLREGRTVPCCHCGIPMSIRPVDKE